jgi:ATP-binding cassette, subfamily F, member 3
MLQLHQITMRRGVKILLNEASVRVDTKDRIGLIGRNGAGKTSLLMLLLGHVKEESGTLLKPKNLTISHLSQELPPPNQIAFAFVRQGDQAWAKLQERIEKAEADNDGMKLAELYSEMESIDGYNIDTRVAIILTGLGFSEQASQQPISSFSGGWQMRLQLAHVLMSRAELLLLDEPTNHLDLETIIWLERWLKSYSGTCIIISHDREFLDRTTATTISLASQKLKRYQGNYTSYAKQFHEALVLQQKQNQKVLQKQQHLQKFVDRFKAKASKAKQAQSRVKAIEKLKLSQDLHQEDSITFEFFDAPPIEGPLINLKADLGYGELKVLNQIDLSVAHSQRIGVIGVNGSGKSTLLKSIAQQIEPVNGSITFNPKTKIGYFSQHQVDLLDLDATPMAHLLAQDKKISESQARGYLGRFGFQGNQAFSKITHFSGGEKARLALALLIWQRPNVLVLDEPTNHLDMQIRETLMMALQSFSGAVLLVSHDRYFIECCVNELWLVREGGVTNYRGNLSDYATDLNATTKENKGTKKNKKSKKSGKKDNKQLEKELSQLEQQLKQVEQALANPTLYQQSPSQSLQDLAEQQKQLHLTIKEKEKEWLDASS